MVRCDYSRLKTFCDKLPEMSLIVLKIITLALSVDKKNPITCMWNFLPGCIVWGLSFGFE